MSKPALALLIAAALALPALTLPASAQTADIKKVPARYTSPASGAEMYQSYCASCHGTKGLGDGPVAAQLKTAVPDLTTLAKQNKGAFPKEQVSKVIRGEGSAKAHGLRDMPVWGPFFLTLDNSQAPVVRIRVSNLANYIESLQAK